jgi:two-component system sensor histidine kinase AlgZ
LIAELIAFFIATVQYRPSGDAWLNLVRLSLFLQWIALSGGAALCLARPWLVRMSNRAASLASYALLLAVTLVLSEVIYRALALSGVRYDFLPDSHWVFILRNLVISAIVSALLLRYFYVQHQWKHNVEREAQARIAALQARIRPHFLFNSMNTIASLIRDKPEIAERTLEDLADLFRASLNTTEHQISLAEEMAVTHQYQRIEALRLGERLQVDWRVDAMPADARIPRLILQPLLENAIYHGIEQLAEGGTVTIAGFRTGKMLTLNVTNPVPGEGVRRRRAGNQMALDNVRERLALAYPGQASLEVTNEAGIFHISLHFPYRNEKHESTDRR